MMDKYIDAQICFVDGEWKLRVSKETVDKIKEKIENDRRTSTKR
jgi:hypothetical protein